MSQKQDWARYSLLRKGLMKTHRSRASLLYFGNTVSPLTFPSYDTQSLAHFRICISDD